MTPFSVQCPHCRARLRLKKAELVGRKVRCPGCGEPFTVRRPGGKPSTARRADVAPAPGSRSPSKRARRPAAATDDDWLAGLSSIEAEPARTTSAAAGPPPKVRRKRRRKKSTQASRPRKRFLRDEDGDLPLAVHRLLMVGTGLGCALVGTLIWGLVMYFAEFEAAFIAILVGVLAGTGVRLGASKWDYGWGPALTAMGIAVVTIVAGKVLGVTLILRGMVGEMREHASDVQQNVVAASTHENMLIAGIADEIVQQREEAGRPVNWPELEDEDFEADLLDPEKIPETYPADIWAAALARWNQLSDAEKQARREQQRRDAEEQKRLMEELESELEDVGVSVRDDAWLLFSPFDLLWFGLACTVAFRIAAGWEDDD